MPKITINGQEININQKAYDEYLEGKHDDIERNRWKPESEARHRAEAK